MTDPKRDPLPLSDLLANVDMLTSKALRQLMRFGVREKDLVVLLHPARLCGIHERCMALSATWQVDLIRGVLYRGVRVMVDPLTSVDRFQIVVDVEALP